jgi:hypothetical protein
MILRISDVPRNRDPGVHFQIVPVYCGESVPHAVQAAAKIAKPTPAVAEVIVLSSKQCVLVELFARSEIEVKNELSLTHYLRLIERHFTNERIASGEQRRHSFDHFLEHR